MGAKSLANGLKEGIKGIAMDPFHGAQEHGAKGFVKGMATGVVGLFAKPASSALSMVSQTAKGFVNTGDFLSDGPRARVHHKRAKRFIDASDPRIRVYDARAAELALEADDDKSQTTCSAGEAARAEERHAQKHEAIASTQIMASVDDRRLSLSSPLFLLLSSLSFPPSAVSHCSPAVPAPPLFASCCCSLLPSLQCHITRTSMQTFLHSFNSS